MPFFMRKSYSLLFLANLLFYSIVNQSINSISLFRNALPALGCNWQRQCTFLKKQQYKFKSLCTQKKSALKICGNSNSANRNNKLKNSKQQRKDEILYNYKSYFNSSFNYTDNLLALWFRCFYINSNN